MRDLIESDEHAGLEFKSSLRWDVKQGNVNKMLERAVAKSVAGFLNSANGGTLLIGVTDENEIYGLENDYEALRSSDRDGFENHLTQVLAKSLGEAVMAFITVTFHDVDGRDVCQISVEPSDHPVYLFEGQGSVFYLRTGNSTRQLPPHEFAKYASTRWGAL